MRAFQRQLLILLSSAIGIACGSDVTFPDEGETGGRGGSVAEGGNGNTGGILVSSSTGFPPPDGFETEVCFDWPQGQGGMGGAGGTTGPLPCPPRGEALTYVPEDQQICGNEQITSEGVFEDGQCCYTMYVQCGVGRPYLDETGRARTAAPARTRGWGHARTDSAGRELSANERQAVAARWQRDAFLEHASIASFGRFALELLMAGAPAPLIEAAHRAALDEVNHARRCFDLARAYGRRDVDAGPMDLGSAVPVSSDLCDVARRTVREGCVGETLAAVLASEQAAVATDPNARETLELIAADEGRHAELAWRAVTWLIDRGGEPVREAVREAFASALAAEVEVDPQPLAVPGHGLLGSAEEEAIIATAQRQIIGPLATQLAG